MQQRFTRFILFLLLVFAFKANAQTAIPVPAKVTRQYNDFLKELHLEHTIRAQTLQYRRQFTQTGNDGPIKLSHVYVLQCQPDSGYETPFKFALDWAKAEHSFGGPQLYHMLFSQLADANGIPADSVAITLKFSELFSFLIYYDNGIKISKITVGIRDDDEAEPGDLNDTSVGGMFLNVPASGNITDQLYNRLAPVLKSYKHRKAINVINRYGNATPKGMLALKVSNISAEVTSNPHEDITINFFVSPAAEVGHFNVYYLFNVFYASGLAEPAAKEYKNAIPDYVDEVRSYGLTLKKNIYTALYQK